MWQRKLWCSYKIYKTSIKSWINTKKVHRVIQFNQKSWLKEYIDINTELRKQATKWFWEKKFQINV